MFINDQIHFTANRDYVLWEWMECDKHRAYMWEFGLHLDFIRALNGH